MYLIENALLCHKSKQRYLWDIVKKKPGISGIKEATAIISNITLHPVHVHLCCRIGYSYMTLHFGMNLMCRGLFHMR